MSVTELSAFRPDDGEPTPPTSVPPQDLYAEASVLGAMMLSKDAIAEVIEDLRAADFYRPAHQVIYDAIAVLFAKDEPADAITVAAELQRTGELGRAGGAMYLHTLVQGVPTAANAEYYARIVIERGMLRRLVDAGNRIAAFGYAGDGDPHDLVDRAQVEVYNVSQQRRGEDYKQLAELVPDTFTQIESLSQLNGRSTGILTGIAGLDDLTHGLQPGQMVVIAARPGMGKSTLALDFARSASLRQGKTCCLFSLEMSRNEIVMRLLSAEGSVRLNHVLGGTVGDDEWQRLATAMGVASAAPMFIDDSANLTMMEIRAKARRLKQRHGLDMIIIDYLQLMSSGKRVESRQVEVSEFSRQMKLLAKELHIPVVALSQLNRGPEQRADKKPMLSDLRESGSIEQDADLVILLHREDVYEKESTRPGEADLIIAKHRNGATGTVATTFHGHYSRFGK
ncbi:MAG: replicative DNA helicase [Actinomycetes bacterium]|jgi:replicative DNA helicase